MRLWRSLSACTLHKVGDAAADVDLKPAATTADKRTSTSFKDEVSPRQTEGSGSEANEKEVKTNSGAERRAPS